jgi:hypothetical protein
MLGRANLACTSHARPAVTLNRPQVERTATRPGAMIIIASNESGVPIPLTKAAACAYMQVRGSERD